jgi:hypothetical protein
MKKLILAACLLSIVQLSQAQTKIKDGSVSATTSLPAAGSLLELESSQAGLRMPQAALTNTTTWLPMLGSGAATTSPGMTVYNTNASITSTNINYPANGIGEYYWDGTGWVSKNASAAQSTPVQVKLSAAAQGVSINSVNNTIVYANTVFDVGNNKSGNTVVIPSSGLYDINASAIWTSNGTGGWALRLFVNNVFTEQFDGGAISTGASDQGAGRVLIRLNAGDVVKIVMVTTQTAGFFNLSGSTFVTIKLSN